MLIITLQTANHIRSMMDRTVEDIPGIGLQNVTWLGSSSENDL